MGSNGFRVGPRLKYTRTRSSSEENGKDSCISSHNFRELSELLKGIKRNNKDAYTSQTDGKKTCVKKEPTVVNYS